MKSIVVIPARYASSRFPGKPLATLLNKPMILWVAELSARAVDKKNVYIATDDSRIQEVVESAGFQVVMTSSKAKTGTDRLAEVAQKVDADFYINVQGDEPMLDPEDIRRIIRKKEQQSDAVINGYAPLEPHENPASPHIPKVVFNENGKMLYMSRAPIAASKSGIRAASTYYKQVCIYAFTKAQLEAYASFGRKSTVESYEDIEILRFLEWNQEILMVETSGGSLAVDIPEDVAKVEQALLERG